MAIGGETQVNGLPESGYRAFLLRCWHEAEAGQDGAPAWRFRLVEPGDEGSGRGFASLEALMAFLREELRKGAPGPAGSKRTEARQDEVTRRKTTWSSLGEE